MTTAEWTYPPELLQGLAVLGIRPRPATRPSVVRALVNDLYRYELRRLRDARRDGRIPKPGYLAEVVALRRRYWVLTLPPKAWGELCRPKGAFVRIALIQQAATEDRDANLNRALEAVRRAAADGAGLCVFAELALTRFLPQHPASGDVREWAEPVPGPTTEVFSAIARELGMVIVLNLYERDGDAAYDCSPIIDADGSLVGRTRMVHITEYPCFHEQQYYTPGNLGAPVFDTRVGRVGVAICYDRHFPEYMRALALGGADLVLIPQAGVVGEWPDGLFEGEVCAAAFQNGYFVALCNRVGVEDRLTFAGESFVCGPEGAVRARAPRGQDATLIVDIDPAEAARSHARQVLLKDRRPDLYADWLKRMRQ